jgi:cytochrome c-type biogenesis protein CcmH
VLVTYLAVSTHDWRASAAGPAAATAPPAGSLDAAIAGLEARLAAAPDDEEGWILLGSSYLSLSRPADAANAYQKALDLSGGRSTAARLGLAEARVVLDPGALSGPAGADIEAVLAIEPANPRALWYSGLRALAGGNRQTARQRWTALLALGPPDEVRNIIEQQLAELDDGSGADIASSAAPAGASIAVAVEISPGLRDRIRPGAPLFVFVREAGTTGGPPIAVLRRMAAELPIEIALSDANVMLPGRSVAGLESASVVARIANGGQPAAQPGDLFGSVTWERDGESGNRASVVIDQVVAP